MTGGGLRRGEHRTVVHGGIYVATDLGFMWHVPILALSTRWIGDKRVTLGIAKYTKNDVLFLEELIEATRYVETEQKTGNVVITVSRNGAEAGRWKRSVET